MMVEVRPLGVLCNIQCQYCYQNPQREAGNQSRLYDLQKMMDAIEAEGGPFALFGGEPLLVPIRDLEVLWSWGYAKYGTNSIQTNGTLVTDEHIRLFQKYNVHVGISIDGPDALNDVRWHRDLETTRINTARTQAAIELLCQKGLRPGLIVTLHRANASKERLPILYDWIRYLHRIGVRSFNLHLLESETHAIRSKYKLTMEENFGALVGFLQLEREIGEIDFTLFAEMRRLLMGDDRKTTCTWYACDPYTTEAVRGVEGLGQRSNCGRTNKDGIDFVKANKPGFERYLALYQTPQFAGGCQECRFFLMCKGQCPGTAIDGDWRNRTEYCEVWLNLYTLLERELCERGDHPLSTDTIRPTVEKLAIERWSQGRKVSVNRLLGELDERGAATGLSGLRQESHPLVSRLAREALK
jgi:uncharacterized protein